MDNLSNSCISEGEADIYGMGIRIGLYLQWTSTLFSFFFIPDTFLELLVANYCFSIAVSIAYLVNRQAINSLEVPIIAMLLTMTLMMIPLEMLYFISMHGDHEEGSSKANSTRSSSDDGPAEGKPQERAVAVLLKKARTILRDNLPAISAASWFLSTTFLLAVIGWQHWEGPNQAQSLDGCRPKLLGSFYLEEPYTYVLKGGYIVLALLIGVTIVLFTLTRLASESKKTLGKGPVAALANRYTHMPATTRRWLRRAAAAAFGIFMSFSIAFIETAIFQNKIQGVNGVGDAGQIIPLCIGVASFLFLVYEILNVVLKRVKKQPLIEEETGAVDVDAGPSGPEEGTATTSGEEKIG